MSPRTTPLPCSAPLYQPKVVVDGEHSLWYACVQKHRKREKKKKDRKQTRKPKGRHPVGENVEAPLDDVKAGNLCRCETFFFLGSKRKSVYMPFRRTPYSRREREREREEKKRGGGGGGGREEILALVSVTD